MPAVVLTLLIGHAADRYDRRLIVRIAQTAYACAALALTAALIAGALSRDLLFAAVFMVGCARAFELPTAHSLMPMLVPERLLPRAVAAWTSANQFAIISGPAAGGLIYALSPTLVDRRLLCCSSCRRSRWSSLVKVQASGRRRANRRPLPRCLPGFDYIRTPQARCSASSRSTCSWCMLGGVTALLPIYARDILSTGPIGLGLLRSAPAVGAFLTTLVLSRHPIERTSATSCSRSSRSTASPP